nr:MAG TPA: head closure knob [Caudoviricetes sp.]
MRYNERVEIITKKQEEYDPEIGEYTSNEEEKFIVPVHVMDLGIDKQVAVFGEYKRGSKVVYFQNAPKISFDYLKYRNERYKSRADKQSGRVFYLEKDNSIG